MISNFQPSPPVDASATTRGLVNLVAQVIAGIKTFTSAIVASAGIQIGAAITGGSGSLLMNNTVGTQCTWNANGLFINAGVAEIAALNIPAQLRGNNAVVRVLSNLGALSTDVVTVAGTTLADASVNAAAKLWSLRTGIGGTEVEQCYFTKTQLFFGGAGVFSLVKDSAGGLAVATSGTPIAVWLPSGISRSGYGFDINPGFGASLSFQALSSGQVNQSGTDSSATPGVRQLRDRPGERDPSARRSACGDAQR